MNPNEGKILPAFSKNNIAVVLYGDNLYVPYMGVLIQSIIDHANPDNGYDIIVLERSISANNKDLMKLFVAPYKNFSLRFYNPSYFFSKRSMAFFERDSTYPLEVYYKLLAPYVLEEYSKIITMDSDMLVKHDIAELYEMDISDYCIGAAANIAFRTAIAENKTLKQNGKPIMTAQEYCRDFLTMKNPYNYVGCGILLINCKEYRTHIDVNNLFQVIESKQFLYLELDPLNIVFEDEIKLIDQAWNMWLLLNPHLEQALMDASPENQKLYWQGRKKPYILHWAGRPKPWVCPDVEYGYEWWETAKKTPYMGHIIVRMMDALEKRREYYRTRYGKDVPVWNPVPEGIDR